MRCMIPGAYSKPLQIERQVERVKYHRDRHGRAAAGFRTLLHIERGNGSNFTPIEWHSG